MECKKINKLNIKIEQINREKHKILSLTLKTNKVKVG